MVTIIGFDETIKKIVTCKNCSAKLEYVPNEVQSYTSRDISGCSDVDYYINCPGCGKDCYVNCCGGVQQHNLRRSRNDETWTI